MDTKKSRILFIIAGAFLIVALCYFVRPKGPVEVDSGHRLVMGTFARVVAIAADPNTANKCIETAFAEIRKVDELMSDYKRDSQICLVNRDGFKRAVKVSESTYEVLQRSIEISELTGGAFDITVGPLVDLLRRAEKKDVTPGEDEIARAKSKVGFEKLILDEKNRTARFAIDGMRLDLGGIAKGYAVDKAIEAMQKAGATGAMVDIGGDIQCFGTAPQGRNHWLIGVQDPKLNKSAGRSALLLTLKLDNSAAATSGDYRRFALLDGKKYSHIIDRDTGSSAEDLSSVTIISSNATKADALATAVSVMGAEKGLALIEKMPQTEAILISSPPSFERMQTSGAEKYICKK